MRGTLYVVAAPSGAGKSSIVNAVLARDPQIALSISFTSRQPRPGERHAQHYNFVSEDEFQQMIDAGDFFEYARVHGDWKGTARQSVEPQLSAGKDVLLEIDWQGARQVRDKLPNAVSVFILPPSRRALEQRMRNRGQDSEAVIAATAGRGARGNVALRRVRLRHRQRGLRYRGGRDVLHLHRQPAAPGTPGGAPLPADFGPAGGRRIRSK